jgi:hypothetical protein
LKSLWVLSAFLIVIGFCIFLYSSVPKTVQEPYMKLTTQTKNNVVQDGEISALSSFYSKNFQLGAGDKISITATINEGTLSANVLDMWTFKEIASQSNVQNVNLDVTVPSDGYYQINVKRYKESVFVIYLEETTASVKVSTITTEQVFVQDYRSVTTYPYKNFETAGIAVMLAGIGAGVLSVAQNKGKNQFSKNNSFIRVS